MLMVPARLSSSCSCTSPKHFSLDRTKAGENSSGLLDACYCLDVGDVLHWLPAALGPESLLCHNSGYEYPDLYSIRRGYSQEPAAWWDGNGPIDTLPLFRPPCAPDPCFHTFLCCRPRFSVSQSWSCGANSRRA